MAEDKKDRLETILLSILSVAVVVIIISLRGGTFENLGEGSWRNTAFSLSMLALAISANWLTIRELSNHQSTPGKPRWKIVAFTALWMWGGVVAFHILNFALLSKLTYGDFTFIPDLIAAISAITVTLIPSLVWLPIWTLILWLRERRQVSSEVTKAPSIVSAPQGEGAFRGVLRNKWVRIGGIAVLAIAILWTADQWQKARELNALTTAIATSENAMLKVIDRQSFELQQYENSARTESDYVATVRQLNQQLNSDLTLAGDDINAVLVLPWHGNNATLRDFYLDHHERWLETTEDLGAADSYSQIVSANDKSRTGLKSTWARVTRHAQSMPLPWFAGDQQAVLDKWLSP